MTASDAAKAGPPAKIDWQLADGNANDQQISQNQK